FRADHRSHGGVYECVAKNGVGDPATAHIRVVVHARQHHRRTDAFASHSVLITARMAACTSVSPRTGSGTPPQHISEWSFMVRHLQTASQTDRRSRITFRADHRSHGGVYECVAKNGVGDPATAHIRVVVHARQHHRRTDALASHSVLITARMVACTSVSPRTRSGTPPQHISEWSFMTASQTERCSRITFRADHRSHGGVYECVAKNGVGDPATAHIRVAVHASQTDRRSRITFRADHRSHGGVYECVAKNGVGDPATGHIRVVVHDAPEVSVENSFVHTAIGLRAALAAEVVFAVPAARTSWYRDGVPNVASFKVDQSLNKATSTSFTLIWEVDSYSTIIEYNLWLRPYYGRLVTSEPDAFTTEAPANMWSKIVVPGDSSDAGRSNSRPTTSDYADITPILEEYEPQPHNITQALIFGQSDVWSNRADRGTASLLGILILSIFLVIIY
ncbi:putative lachesin, partial [Operophtera brumata]